MNIASLRQSNNIFVGGVVILAIVVFVLLVLREPQTVCVQAVSASGMTMQIDKNTLLLGYVPVRVTLPTGKHTFTLFTPEGAREGSVQIFDAKSPEVNGDNVLTDLVRIDYCNFLSSNDVYVVDEGGVLVVYKITTKGVEPTGLRLTPNEHDGALMPMNVVVAVNGKHIAYNVTDPDGGSDSIVVSEVDGKNAHDVVVVGTADGELLPESMLWSEIGKVVYTIRTPISSEYRATNPDKTTMLTGYTVNIATLATTKDRIVFE